MLTARDKERLKGVHPDLVRIVERAAEMRSFMVVQGLRTPEEQKKLFALGKSRTLRSRHLTGHAVDLAPLVDLDGDGDQDLSWNPVHFWPIAEAMKDAAEFLKIKIVWGGEAWRPGFVDMPHYELDRATYP
jgi:peptidoglycan L-alanyl-D-glutamate endopeptidase CwlK